MELPIGELEEQKPKRSGPPPLPGQKAPFVSTTEAEPAESTTPTEIPPPLPKTKSAHPPARLGRSVVPPDPATFKMKSPAEVRTARQKESTLKSTRRMKFKPGDLPFEDKPSKASTRPSAPPPPTAAALRLSSKPPPLTSKTPSKPPPLKASKAQIASKPPAPAPVASKPSAIRTAVTRPGTKPATTTSVGEAAKIARIRFLEEELRDLKSRIADHTRRVTARLDAVAVRVDKLESTTQPRSTLLEQRVDEMGEDFEEKLSALETQVQTLRDAEATAPTQTMPSVPPPPDELEAELREKLETELRDTLAADLREKLEAELRESLTAEVRDSLQAELRASIAESLQASIEATLDAKIKAEVEAKLSALPAAAPAKKKKAKKDADALTQIKGVGPASAKKLRKQGVETVAAVAAWTDDDIDKIHNALGTAKKRLKEWRAAAKSI